MTKCCVAQLFSSSFIEREKLCQCVRWENVARGAPFHLKIYQGKPLALMMLARLCRFSLYILILDRDRLVGTPCVSTVYSLMGQRIVLGDLEHYIKTSITGFESASQRASQPNIRFHRPSIRPPTFLPFLVSLQKGEDYIEKLPGHDTRMNRRESRSVAVLFRFFFFSFRKVLYRSRGLDGIFKSAMHVLLDTGNMVPHKYRFP